jgi:succinylglutamate desuccinylase
MKYLIIIILFVFAYPLYSQEITYVDKNFFIIKNILGENEEYETPYFVFVGDKEYPKIVIDACIHGDEIAGTYACDSVMKYIKVKSGTVIFVPKVNIKAFNTGVREVNIDLNQVFPGNSKSTLYEERLAFDFMKLVEDFKPDVVINLHEAWTRFNETLYQKHNDKSFGQVLITNKDTTPVFLDNALLRINSLIENPENKFRVQYFPYKPNHSMDNIIEKLKTASFTVETLRTLPLEERIDYQIICILAFLNETGIKYTYKK